MSKRLCICKQRWQEQLPGGKTFPYSLSSQNIPVTWHDFEVLKENPRIFLFHVLHISNLSHYLCRRSQWLIYQYQHRGFLKALKSQVCKNLVEYDLFNWDTEHWVWDRYSHWGTGVSIFHFIQSWYRSFNISIKELLHFSYRTKYHRKERTLQEIYAL